MKTITVLHISHHHKSEYLIHQITNQTYHTNTAAEKYIGTYNTSRTPAPLLLQSILF